MKVQDIFICPQCDGHRIEEIITNAAVTSEVVDTTECGDIKYNTPDIDEGIVDRYQCVNCGYAIPGVSNGVELYAHLLSSGNKRLNTSPKKGAKP